MTNGNGFDLMTDQSSAGGGTLAFSSRAERNYSLWKVAYSLGRRSASQVYRYGTPQFVLDKRKHVLPEGRAFARPVSSEAVHSFSESL
jgi:hypothetical protein